MDPLVIADQIQTELGTQVALPDLIDLVHEVLLRLQPEKKEGDPSPGIEVVTPKLRDEFAALDKGDIKRADAPKESVRPAETNQVIKADSKLTESEMKIVAGTPFLSGLEEIRGDRWIFSNPKEAEKAFKALNSLPFPQTRLEANIISGAPNIIYVGQTKLGEKESAVVRDIPFLWGLRDILPDRWVFQQSQEASNAYTMLNTLAFASSKLDQNFIFFPPNIFDVMRQWRRNLQDINPRLLEIKELYLVEQKAWVLTPRTGLLEDVLKQVNLTINENGQIQTADKSPLTLVVENNIRQRAEKLAIKPLTEAQTNDIMRSFWQDLPKELGRQLISSLAKPGGYVGRRNWDEFRRDVEYHLRLQLREVSICDTQQARDELKEDMIKIMSRAMNRPGKPVSYEAIEAIIAQLTQINLKSYHNAGAIGTISTGATAAREMINLSHVRAQELITTHFKDKKMSVSAMLTKRRSMVEIMLDDIVTDSEMFLLPDAPNGDPDVSFVRPWWHQIYIRGDSARYNQFAAQSKWITRLTISVVDCYRHGIRMADIVKTLQQNTCFYVMAGPLAEGFIDVVVNEQEALNDMQINSKYLQEGKNKNTSTCRVTGSSRTGVCQPGAKEGKRVSKKKMTEARKAALREIDKFWIPGQIGDTGAIQVYHDIELNESLSEFRVKGIPGVNNLEPIKVNYWGIVTRVQPTLQLSNRPLSLYDIDFDIILQRILPLTPTDVFERLEMQGVVNISPPTVAPLLAVVGKELWKDVWKPEAKDGIWIVQARSSITALNKVVKMLGISKVKPDYIVTDKYGQITTVYLDSDPVTTSEAWAQQKFPNNPEIRSSIAVDVVRKRYELLPEDIKFYIYAMIKLRIRRKTDFENVTNLCEPIYGIWRRRDINAKYTYSNNIHRTYHTLGNYAARNWYIMELNELVLTSGGSADPAHVIFMGDFMSSTGMPLPFSYSGSRKHNPNTLSMMSQQRPLTQILLAGTRGLNVPTTTSVSGSIYVGVTPRIGPGLVGENYNVEYKEYMQKLRAEGLVERPAAGVPTENPATSDMYEEEEGTVAYEQYSTEAVDYSLLNQITAQIQTTAPSFGIGL